MSSLERFAPKLTPFIICSHCIVLVICVCMDILFSSLIIVLTFINNRSLSDPCMNILNKLGLCAYVCVDVLCSCFFSPLGKLAGRAIYFTDVFSLFF